MALHGLGLHFFDRWPYRPLDGRRQRHAVRSVRNQGPAMVGGALMTYRIKPLSCDPAKIKGMSARLIVSHYENNYGGRGKLPALPATPGPPPGAPHAPRSPTNALELWLRAAHNTVNMS